jgi:ectoine hydroxylase-related dioxygenase (phytanoyl-CoA dioxygenase family)
MPDSTASGLPEATTNPARLKADLDQHGYCLAAEALSPDQLARVRERLEAQATAERALDLGFGNDVHMDATNQWVGMLINKGAPFVELVANPVALELVSHVLGAEHLLSVLEAHVVNRGGSPMALHSDQWWMPFPVAPDAAYPRVGAITRATVPKDAPASAGACIWPPAVINVMYMVSDYTEANGATRIVPGSHLFGRQPPGTVPHPVETIAAEGAAGTAVIWEGRTWHAAGLNVTDQPRRGITATYCGPMFRQLTNFPVGTRADVLRGASPELRRLLGFKVWSDYGAIDDMSAEFIAREEGAIGELRP